MLDVLELKARRLYEKLTQEEFAKILRISQNYLSELESGHKKVSKALEVRYDQLYPKRLISITWKRGVECQQCHTIIPPEKLNDPKDELDTIYRCRYCGHYFTVGESWGLHYRT